MAECLLDSRPATASVRPAYACLLCPPPSGDRSWRQADAGYRTCDICLDKLRELLHDIASRYLQLNASPGANRTDDGTGRGTPGFGSRPAAALHIVTLTDARSKTCEVSWDKTVYEGWKLDLENGWVLRPLPAGVQGPEAIGVYTQKRDAWVGADKRPHSESANPPRSVQQTLDALASWIAEERDMRPPRPGVRLRAVRPHCRIVWVDGRPRPEPRPHPVAELRRWIDAQLDYVTRQDWVADVATQLRALQTQLMPVTGDPRIWIARCPNVVDHGDTTELCDANLYYPLHGDTIQCGNPPCRRRWTRDKWDGDGPDCLLQLVKVRRERRAAE